MKIPLVVTGGLTIEICLGVHHLVKLVVKLGRRSGWLYVALYCKQASTCFMHYSSSTHPKRLTELSVPISLTRTGLPRIIPPFHRKVIRRRDDRADIVVKLYLSLL